MYLFFTMSHFWAFFLHFRYRLVFEYYDSPIFPPPLNFVSYIISLINYLRGNKAKTKNITAVDNEDDDQQEIHAKGI